MTEYDSRLGFPVLFHPELPSRTLAEVLSEAGLRQFHCAETEKYPHVTYFFNGGRETPFPGEDRAFVPSPNVATYDEQPEMSAARVADRTIAAVVGGHYDFVLVNFANGDMVGHTATRHAAVRAVETLDLQGHRVIQAALHRGYTVLVTADPARPADRAVWLLSAPVFSSSPRGRMAVVPPPNRSDGDFKNGD